MGARLVLLSWSVWTQNFPELTEAQTKRIKSREHILTREGCEKKKGGGGGGVT